MRVVLDTNVLVSGLMNPSGTPGSILALVIDKKVKILVDNRILFEYLDVLSRDKFGFRPEVLGPFFDYIHQVCEYVFPEPAVWDMPDPDDRIFYEAGKSGRADYLVTGNSKHYPREEFIVSPSEFVEAWLGERG